MNSIIIYRDGQEYGPYSLEEVRGYLSAGQISDVDYARQSDSSDWLPLKDLLATVVPPALPALPPPLEKNVPPIPSEMNKTGCLQKGCAWLLVIVLLLIVGVVGLIILGSVSKESPSGQSSNSQASSMSDFDFDQTASDLKFTPISIINDHELICMVKTNEYDTKTVHICDIDTTSMADGDYYTAMVWKIGVYRYTTQLGAEAQVESYTASREVARKALNAQ